MHSAASEWRILRAAVKREKSMMRTTFGLSLQAAVVFLLVAGAGTVVPAQVSNGVPNWIVGVWDVQVTVRNCLTRDPIASWRGLHKYELGGTGQIVPSTNPAGLSAHVSTWEPVGKNLYKMNFKMFRFDGSGNNIGWAVVKNDIVLSEDGTLYAGSGKAEFFDINGNLQGSSCPEFSGTRFQ